MEALPSKGWLALVWRLCPDEAWLALGCTIYPIKPGSCWCRGSAYLGLGCGIEALLNEALLTLIRMLCLMKADVETLPDEAWVKVGMEALPDET